MRELQMTATYMIRPPRTGKILAWRLATALTAMTAWMVLTTYSLGMI